MEAGSFCRYYDLAAKRRSQRRKPNKSLHSANSVLPEQRPFLSSAFSPHLDYMYRPARASQLEEDFALDETPSTSLQRGRLQSTPSSCYSDWDSSLWNTWSSVSDTNMASARTSLISSVDSCYTNDSANFARLLAVAAESMSGASLSGEQRISQCFSVFYTSKT